VTQSNPIFRPGGRNEFTINDVLNGEFTSVKRRPIELLRAPVGDVAACVAIPQAPAVLAPLVDGLAASKTAPGLLLAVGNLGDVYLDVWTAGVRWMCHGPLQAAMSAVTTVRIAATGFNAEIQSNRIIAVSYCADSTSSGFALFVEAGKILTLWSTDVSLFETWLQSTLHNLKLRGSRDVDLNSSWQVPSARQCATAHG